MRSPLGAGAAHAAVLDDPFAFRFRYVYIDSKKPYDLYTRLRCLQRAVHIRLPWEGPARSHKKPWFRKPSFVLSRLIERFLAADGQNALGTKVSQKPKYSSSFLPCQSLLLTNELRSTPYLRGNATPEPRRRRSKCAVAARLWSSCTPYGLRNSERKSHAAVRARLAHTPLEWRATGAGRAVRSLCLCAASGCHAPRDAAQAGQDLVHTVVSSVCVHTYRLNVQTCRSAEMASSELHGGCFPRHPRALRVAVAAGVFVLPG